MSVSNAQLYRLPRPSELAFDTLESATKRLKNFAHGHNVGVNINKKLAALHDVIVAVRKLEEKIHEEMNAN